VRLCLVHGFTQTGTSWEPVTARLRGRGYDVVTPDVAGHGRNSDACTDLWGAADLLASDASDAQAARSARDAVWVGYSMGGRVVLHLALAHPELVAGLVLVSTTAGITDDAERAERRRADETLACDVERDGVAAFVERWLEGPLWGSLPRERAGIEHRLGNTAPGLASSLRLAGTGSQEPLWPRLAEISAPVLVVTGERDVKFAKIGAELAAAFPSASVATIEGAGHAAPWEQPDAFVDVVDRWLTHVRQ